MTSCKDITMRFWERSESASLRQWEYCDLIFSRIRNGNHIALQIIKLYIFVLVTKPEEIKQIRILSVKLHFKQLFTHGYFLLFNALLIWKLRFIFLIVAKNLRKYLRYLFPDNSSFFHGPLYISMPKMGGQLSSIFAWSKGH